MAVDAAGQHIAAGCVDVAGTGGKALRHGGDFPATDADVATRRLGRGGDDAVADGEFEIVQGSASCRLVRSIPR